MRKVIVVVAILIAAFVGFGLSTLNTGVKRAADAYVSAAAKAGKREVSYGSTGISFFPVPSVTVKDLIIAGAPEYGGEPLLRAPEVRVRPKLLSMLTGSAEISSVELVAPTLTLFRRSTGETDLGKWLAGADRDEAVNVSVPLRVSGGRIKFQQSMQGVEDYNGGPFELLFEDIKASLEPTREDGTTVFSVNAGAPGDGARIRASGSLRPTGETTKGVDVDVDYAVNDFDADAASIMLPGTEGIVFSGPLSLQGEFKGFAGGRSTEAAPAEKLSGTVKGSGGISVFGVVEPVTFDMKVSHKEERIRLDDAKLQWAGADFHVKGWASHLLAGRALLNIGFTGLNTDTVLAKYGFRDSRRPRGVFDGTIRMEGSFKKPMLRYEATSKGVTMDFSESYPVAVGPLTAKGILMSISADFSAAVVTEFVSAGSMRVNDTSFGVRYFRDKLTSNLSKGELWDGVATVAARYEPLKSNANEVAGLFDDLDAEVVFKNVFPDLAADITGRMDAIVQIGNDDDGTWALGRVGLHKGSYPGLSFGTAIIEPLASRPGLRSMRDNSIKQQFKASMDGPDTKFRKVKFDFQSRDGGFDLGSIIIQTDSLDFRGSGRATAKGVVDVTGDSRLTPAYRDRVFQALPDLRKIRAADGTLHIPTTIKGAVGSFSASVPKDFVSLAERAVAGRPVSPQPAPSTGEPLEFDLPELAEEYGR